MADGSKRLLFFDLLRITGILLVVLCHIGIFYNIHLFTDTYNFSNIFFISFGPIGVALFIFVSGAVLEYNHGNLRRGDYLQFIKRRLCRIYPAYWMSLLFAALFVPVAYDWNLLNDLVLSYSGFMAFFGNWGGMLNNAGWFIGLIVVLYLCYPLISRLTRAHPFATLTAMALISMVSRYVIVTYHIGSGDTWRWFPLSSLIWFTLGIFIVRTGYYPGTENRWSSVRFFSDISYYVFLLNMIIADLIVKNLVLYLLVLVFLSWLFLLADNRVQKMIKDIRMPDLSIAAIKKAGRGHIRLIFAAEIVVLLLIGTMAFVIMPEMNGDNAATVEQQYQESYQDTVAANNDISAYGMYNGTSIGSYQIWVNGYDGLVLNFSTSLRQMQANADIYSQYISADDKESIDDNVTYYVALQSELLNKSKTYWAAYDAWYWNGTLPDGFTI
jgi:peptidoglycan/LPS O-acetylase OafA/YrhL